MRNRGGIQNDVPSLDLIGPVEIDEGTTLPNKPAGETRSRARRACPRTGMVRTTGTSYPFFIIADRGTGQRHVVPAKAADE